VLTIARLSDEFRSAEIAAGLELTDEFAGLIRKRSDGTLAEWLARGEASSCLELRRFAEGIRRVEEAAVQGAVRERLSNGPVEGHVNRLKTIKGQMYGRASLVLLRARVVRHA
jgi:transposase